MVPLMDSENRQAALLFLLLFSFPRFFSSFSPPFLLLTKSNQANKSRFRWSMPANRFPVYVQTRTLEKWTFSITRSTKHCQVDPVESIITLFPSRWNESERVERRRAKGSTIAEVAQAGSRSFSPRGLFVSSPFPFAEAEQIVSFRTKKRNVLSWQASLVDINSSHGRSGASWWFHQARLRRIIILCNRAAKSNCSGQDTPGNICP